MKCLYEPLHQPINPKDCDHEFVTMEEVMEAVDEMDETDFFEHLCELHGIPCSMVEYLYETAYGSSERKRKVTIFYKGGFNYAEGNQIRKRRDHKRRSF